jgi:hypothetical protein
MLMNIPLGDSRFPESAHPSLGSAWLTLVMSTLQMDAASWLTSGVAQDSWKETVAVVETAVPPKMPTGPSLDSSSRSRSR